jgi:cell division transport system ATP-binding protein
MLLEFRDVSKRYEGGTVALEKVNLSIDKGEFVFLTGSSGAGKTTLLKLIYLDQVPSEGEVAIGDYVSSDISKKDIAMLRRKVGVVFQEFKLLKDLTAFENVVLPLRAAGKKDSEIRKRVNSVLYSVGLSSKRHQFPPKLSGGEQQRVAIARAMALRPSILLADEPTGNLDPDTAAQIFELLLDINRGGTSVLVATHDIQNAKRLEKRLIVLDKGRVVEDGTGDEVAEQDSTGQDETMENRAPDGDATEGGARDGGTEGGGPIADGGA